MTRGRTLSLFVALLLALGNTGCVGAALLDAAARETDDHGRGARHENKSYGEHFLDSMFEPEDDDDC